MTRLRAAAAAARLALRDNTSSTSPRFGSVAPRPHSYAPVPCSVPHLPVSRLSSSFRDCSISVSLEELQRDWERDPSSAGHWIDSVAGVRSALDHWVDAGAGVRSSPDHWVVAGIPCFAGIPGKEDIQLLLVVRAYEISGHAMGGSVRWEDRPFPDRFYRRNRADLEREFIYGVSAMPDSHFEMLSTLPPQETIICKHYMPLDCHLDDRVCSDWFWEPEAAAVHCSGIGMPPKVINKKASLLKLYHCKLLGDERLMRGSESGISGGAINVLNGTLGSSRCDLLANRNWLWSGFKSPGQTSHAHFRLPNASELMLPILPPQETIICKHYRPLDCHLDDKVCNDWFWEPEVVAVHCSGIGMPPKVINIKASLLKLYPCKLLRDERLMRGSERGISGGAISILNEFFGNRCDLPANRDWLWSGVKSPGQISHAHFRLPNASELKLPTLPPQQTIICKHYRPLDCHLDEGVCSDWFSEPEAAGVLCYGMSPKMDNCSGRYSRCQACSNSCSVGFGLIHSLHGSQLHYRCNAVMAHKRCYSTSENQISELRQPKSPPMEWLAPVFEESVMRRALLPNSLPSYALQVKTIPGVIPEVCSDESTFLLNYDPYEYVKARPLFQRQVIYGSKCKVSGDQPFIWLPHDHTLQLFQSLPLLAHFFHEQSVCLPRLSLKDLAITGNGTFRSRGTAIKFHECSPENIKDVYKNIRTLLRELTVASVGPDILKKTPDELDSLFQLMSTGRIEDEYLICYHSFYIPLSNKCHALLRIIDKLIEYPDATFTERCLECVLPTGVDWQPMARSNEYLEQWLNYRTYSFKRRQFILYLRAIIVHKLEHKLPDKFVDFLLYATFQTVLMNLQKTLWAFNELRNLHLEELYLHNSERTGFVSYKDVSLIVSDGHGAVREEDFPFGRKILEEMQQEEMWPENKRKYKLLEHKVQQKSLLLKLRLMHGGITLGKVFKNDMLTRFAYGDDTGVYGIGDFSDMTEPDS